MPKKHFQEYKNIDIFKTMDLFKKTPLFKELIEQSIKIDFEKREFVMPDFFIKVAINHEEDREIEKDVYENIKSKITNIYF